jgi:predicted HAD superfamily phosphohydrolase YqeG
MVHHEEGAKQVQNKKQELIAMRKLVLVLDLDNTLIHSKEVKPEDMQFK